MLIVKIIELCEVRTHAPSDYETDAIPIALTRQLIRSHRNLKIISQRCFSIFKLVLCLL